MKGNDLKAHALQLLLDGHHAWRGNACLGHCHQLAFPLRAALDRGHGDDGRRCLCQDALGHPVQAQDVGHRMDHGNVLGANVRAKGGLAACHGRDHHLGDTNRQRAHGRRGHRRSLGAPHGYDAIHLALGIEPGYMLHQPIDHSRLAEVPVSAGDQVCQFVPACPGYLFPAHISRDGRFAQNAWVDHQWAVPALAYLIPDKASLRSFCIQRADDGDLHSTSVLRNPLPVE